MAEDIILNLKERNLLIFVIVVMLVVLTLPTFIRFYEGNDSLIGSEPYYHFRAAREIIKLGSYNPFVPPAAVHDLVYTDRDYFFSPYHYILTYASRFVSLFAASRIVPLLLGMISLLVFNLILRSFVEEAYKRHIILLLLVMSPAFIYTFTVSNPQAAAIMFSMLGFYFFLRDGRLSLFLSVLFFAVVSLFSLFNTLLVIVLLLAFILTKNERQSRFVIVVFLLAIFSVAKRASLFYNYTYTPQLNVFGNIFSDLGGIIGFGVFSIILAVYGVSSGWRFKQRFVFFFVLALMLLGSLFFVGNVSNMYLMFFIAVAAGIGLVELYDAKWKVRPVKSLALLILFCGLLFSTASYMTRIGSMPPDKGAVESLEWMGANAFKDSVVLGSYDDGYLISTLARNPVLADSFVTAGYDQRFVYKLQDSIFYSRNLDNVKYLFKVYNVKYIYITPEMRSGKVWSRPDEGLLFLLTSKSTFQDIYSKDGYEVWEVINATSTT
jgi:hypothetical protein